MKKFDIAVVLRANRQIGTGHLMRLKPLLPYLKEKARVHLYVYAFDEKLRPLCDDYDSVHVFATADDIKAHLLALPQKAKDILRSAPAPSASASGAHLKCSSLSTGEQDSSSLSTDDCTALPSTGRKAKDDTAALSTEHKDSSSLSTKDCVVLPSTEETNNTVASAPLPDSCSTRDGALPSIGNAQDTTTAAALSTEYKDSSSLSTDDDAVLPSPEGAKNTVASATLPDSRSNRDGAYPSTGKAQDTTAHQDSSSLSTDDNAVLPSPEGAKNTVAAATLPDSRSTRDGAYPSTGKAQDTTAQQDSSSLSTEDCAVLPSTGKAQKTSTTTTLPNLRSTEQDSSSLSTESYTALPSTDKTQEATTAAALPVSRSTKLDSTFTSTAHQDSSSLSTGKQDNALFSVDTSFSSPEQEKLADLILIDDYALDASFEKPLFSRAKLFVIDDLQNRTHCCHALVDQSLLFEDKEQQYRALCNPQCKLLLGPLYSLTAEHFYPQFFTPLHCSCGAHYGPYVGRVALPQCPQAQCSACMCCDGQLNPCPRVLVSFGGADPLSASLKLSKAILQGQLYKEWSFTFIAGIANPDYDAIMDCRNTIPLEYRSHFNVIRHCSDIADLLYRHELSIGAYGGMLRERIATGLPTIGVVIADNQFEGPFIYKRYNIGLNLDINALSQANIVEKQLQTLLAHASSMTEHCLKIYDGQGLKRIATAVLDLINP